MRFETAAAFRASLEQRLKSESESESEKSAVSLAYLRKRVVFHRFLARLALMAPDSWVLKGALALDFRTQRPRTTMDMDLATTVDRENAIEMMLTAAGADLSDFFAFGVKTTDARANSSPSSIRFRVRAELAGRPFETVLVDVGLEDTVLWEPEFVPVPDDLSFADLPALSVPVLSLEQHVAHRVSRASPGVGAIVRPTGARNGTENRAGGRASAGGPVARSRAAETKDRSFPVNRRGRGTSPR